jgi:hypothetical protein
MVGVRPLRVLILIHRRLSIPLCLLFVMWFASGIVGDVTRMTTVARVGWDLLHDRWWIR